MNGNQTNGHWSPTAGAYAQAVLELASEQNIAPQVQAELAAIRDAVQSDARIEQFLADPSISTDERRQVIERSLAGTSSPIIRNLLLVLADRNRMGLLVQVATAYADLLQQQQGIVEVDVTVAHRLDEQELAQVTQRIGQALGRQAVVRQAVDDSIIGGMVLRIEDKLIDASARGQLEAMRQQLLSMKPT